DRRLDDGRPAGRRFPVRVVAVLALPLDERALVVLDLGPQRGLGGVALGQLGRHPLLELRHLLLVQAATPDRRPSEAHRPHALGGQAVGRLRGSAGGGVRPVAVSWLPKASRCAWSRGMPAASSRSRVARTISGDPQTYTSWSRQSASRSATSTAVPPATSPLGGSSETHGTRRSPLWDSHRCRMAAR